DLRSFRSRMREFGHDPYCPIGEIGAGSSQRGRFWGALLVPAGDLRHLRSARPLGRSRSSRQYSVGIRASDEPNNDDLRITRTWPTSGTRNMKSAPSERG